MYMILIINRNVFFFLIILLLFFNNNQKIESCLILESKVFTISVERPEASL